MSRRMNTNTRGRQATRGPQLKLTFGGGKIGTKAGSQKATTISKNKKKQRLPSFSEAESTSSGGESEDDYEGDEETEEGDDEVEEPEAFALSQGTTLRSEAGLNTDGQNLTVVPEAGDWDGFSDLSDVAEDIYTLDQERENNIFASDDDLVYERVNEVSESEGEADDDELTKAEEKIIEAELSADDMTSHFANQIDGMSAYGFGDDTEEEGSIFFPFSSSDEAHEAHGRRVRFEEHLSIVEQQEVGVPNAFAAFGHSPTMTRALLPSALPENNDDENDEQENANASDEDDGFDSDATEELENPAEAWQLSSARRPTQAEHSSPAPSARKTPAQKCPVRGTFEDDGAKATAILDVTGRKLLVSDAHLLGGVFARKYGPSVPASPSNSFASAVLNESDSSRSQESGSPRPQTAQSAPFDLMLSGLTSGENASTTGQVTGLPEAFMPANTSFLNAYITTDLFGGEDDIPDGKLRLEDMIVFDMENDGIASAPDSPMLTSFLPESLSAPNTPLAHLNNMNVAQFKRRNEPHFKEPLPSPLRNKFATPLKRKRGSARFDSPYNDAHYQGVTPVQRITYNEPLSSPAPSSSHMHKRRKTIM